MAFQDFSGLSERRRAEKQQKLRKRIVIAAASVFVLAALVACAVCAVVYESKQGGGSKAQVAKQTKEIPNSAKAIKMMCAPTDYKKICETKLTKAVGSKPSGSQPKELVATAISLTMDEVKKAFNHSSKFKVDDPKVKGAVEDCKELLDYALADLNTTLSKVHGHELGHLPEKSHDLKTWLSAAITYQETCVDGFPEGEFKSKMKEAMITSKELTSNALAIINEMASLINMLQIPGISHSRQLDEQYDNTNLMKGDAPHWMNDEERRMLKESNVKLTPDMVVAQDGSGDYKTINEALKNLPKDRKGRYVIYIKEGTYEETVVVDKKMENITMFGDGSRKTIITGNKNFVDGTRTFQTATFAAIGDGFMAKDVAFRNTAGAIKHQAVALRVQSDHSVFLNCRMEGYQDTLYAQTHRQFYRGCVVCGTVDFIFGDAAAIFQNCIFVVRKPMDNQKNIVTAQGRTDRQENTGFAIQNCKFTADKKLIPLKGQIKSYLGRPWKEYSRTIVMESIIGDLIHPDGWLEWDGDFALKTLVYREFDNKGPGASVDARVKWPGYKVMKKDEASNYTVDKFIQGGNWIKPSGTPVNLGFFGA